MAFTIPNSADASFADQAEPHQADIDILVAAAGGTGVVSGCAVTAQGSPDMTIAVAAGTIKVGETQVAVAGGNSSAMTADGTNPRFYLIEITNAGAIALNAGTAAANPAKPAPTANRVVVAEVYIPANDTAIGSTQIVDKRVLIGTYQPLDSDLTALAAISATAMTTRSLTFVIDGGSATPATGVYEGTAVRVPWACVPVRWSIYGDPSGSAVVDILRDTHANFPPTDGDRIAGTDKPTLGTEAMETSTALTGWASSLSAGDVLVAELESVTTCTHITVVVEVTLS